MARHEWAPAPEGLCWPRRCRLALSIAGRGRTRLEGTVAILLEAAKPAAAYLALTSHQKNP